MRLARPFFLRLVGWWVCNRTNKLNQFLDWKALLACTLSRGSAAAAEAEAERGAGTDADADTDVATVLLTCVKRTGCFDIEMAEKV